MKSDHRGIRTCALPISFCNLTGFSGGIAGKLSEFLVYMSCNTSSLHINGIPVENQESRSVKLKNLYDIFYSVLSSDHIILIAFPLWLSVVTRLNRIKKDCTAQKWDCYYWKVLEIPRIVMYFLAPREFGFQRNLHL